MEREEGLRDEAKRKEMMSSGDSQVHVYTPGLFIDMYITISKVACFTNSCFVKKQKCVHMLYIAQTMFDLIFMYVGW